MRSLMTSQALGRIRPSHDGAPLDAALVVEHLTKRFGERVAFNDVSFEVGYGEVFGFLGPNGAGKTTTVRTLGTLLAPTSGSATVAGIELRPENGPAIRSCISIMPESPGLYLRLTVRENLECFAGLYELDDVRGRIERALRAVNLEDRAGDQCGSLSKGLRQTRRAGASTAQRPLRAVPRRADVWPRPGGEPRSPRADRLASRTRSDDLSHDAPTGRGRAALSPGGDLEHHVEDDRTAR